MTLVGVPTVVVVAVAALMSGLLMGHVINLGQLTANQLAPQGTTTADLATYPGQQQRGVFQTINRVVAAGNTIVTMGSQTSDGVVRAAVPGLDERRCQLAASPRSARPAAVKGSRPHSVIRPRCWPAARAAGRRSARRPSGPARPG